MAQAFTFDEAKDLYLNTLDVPAPEGPNSVVVELLAAPINPIDHMVLAKAYPVKPQTFISELPVPGYDGVARVSAVGSSVTTLQVGDHVVIKRHGLGTWRTHAAVDAKDLMRVDPTLDHTLAAILRMSLAPAYYMLEENTAHLRVGDWIIHTAATGVIAHFITQLAKLRGFKILAVIRHPDDASSSFDDTARRLRVHGADAVVSEAELAGGSSAAPFAGKRIKLALDAVGGQVGQRLIGVCSPGALFVTYAFQSVTPTTPLAITPLHTWRDAMTFKGFRLTKALASRSEEEQQDILDWLVSMLKDGKLTAPRLETLSWDRKGTDILEKMRAILRPADADKKRVGKSKTVIVFQ